jgi:arylsulfatase A-like enzyme
LHGCSGEDTVSELSAASAELRFAGATESWRVPLPRYAESQAPVPLLDLQIHRHSGQLTSDPIEIRERGTLEFVPIVFGPAREGCSVDLDLVGAGPGERLWSGSPRFAPEEQVQDPLRTLTRLVEIDLAPQAETVQLRWTPSAACEGAPSALARVAFRPERKSHPPVLFVCSDTHRYDHSLGDAAALMPRLQQLAESAVVYDRAYSNASWTLPSVTSTLTGLYPRYHRTGLRVEREAQRQKRGQPVPPGRFRVSWEGKFHVFTSHPHGLPNLGGRLRELGYETVAVVANTLYVGSGLLSSGFDLVIDANGLTGEGINRLAGLLLERTGQRRPLFLLVHYMDVHEYFTWGRGDDEPPGTLESIGPPELQSRYARQVQEADAYIAELALAWDRRVGLDRSFFAFYSDHGEHLREPGRPTERHGDSMDEVLLHVPMLIRYPSALGVSPAREKRVVSLVDLAPTLLDAIGAEADADAMQGVSLLRPEPTGAAARRIFADYQLAGDELASVRAGPFKLLMNLTRDTTSLLDVAAPVQRLPEIEQSLEDAARMNELAREFETYRESAESWSADLVTDRAIDEDFEERLRAIGYAE